MFRFVHSLYRKIPGIDTTAEAAAATAAIIEYLSLLSYPLFFKKSIFI